MYSRIIANLYILRGYLKTSFVTLSLGLVLLSGWDSYVLDVIVPPAAAADLMASSNVPTLNFDDLDSLAINNDFRIQASDTNNGGSIYIEDDTGSISNAMVILRKGEANDRTIDLLSNGDLRLGGSTVYIDRGNSRLGIGTGDPSYKFEAQTTGEDSEITATRTDGARVQIAARGNKAQMGTVSNHRFNLVVANSPKMTLDKTGYVGIGVSTPEHLLHLNGGAYSDGANWVDGSSRELKENIKDLSPKEAIVALNDLNPVKFNYKADKEAKHVGFIAEDVPELVATKDRKGLSSMDIVAVLTKVVQEQQATINDHRQTIEQLSRKITELENKIK